MGDRRKNPRRVAAGKRTAAKLRAKMRWYITVSLRGPSKTIRLPQPFMSKESAYAAIDFNALYRLGFANGHTKIIGASVTGARLPYVPQEVLYP